jgi:hypothetical protein
MKDARWFIDETRENNHIRRQGEIYVIDDPGALTKDHRPPSQSDYDLAGHRDEDDPKDDPDE